MDRPQSASRHAGFTLIEMLVILSLAAILLAMSYPELMKYYLRSQLEGTAREMSLAMQQARYQAIKNGQATTVCADTANKVVTGTAGAKVFSRIELPKSVAFDAPAPQTAITVTGNCFTFQADGSVAETGSFRMGDPRGNYLEVRIEPQATARVQVRKWDDVDNQWYTRGQGGKAWEWKTGTLD